MLRSTWTISIRAIMKSKVLYHLNNSYYQSVEFITAEKADFVIKHTIELITPWYNTTLGLGYKSCYEI
jgi:hypothetical protein